MASHFKGPLLGSSKTEGGLYEDLPLAVFDRPRSPYTVWYEEFDEECAAGELILRGAHVDDQNTATAPDQIITSELGCLQINPGTKAASGSSVVFDIVPVNTATGRSWNTPRAITCTPTLMDNRELIWAARVGISTDSVDFAWDGAVIMGWFVADTTPISTATFLPTISAGGGAGFYIAPTTGAISVLCTQGTVVTAGTATGLAYPDIDTTPLISWHDYAFRIRWDDASASTGKAEFFVDGVKYVTKTTDLPMANILDYSSKFIIVNGAAQLSELYVDYLAVAISRPGIATNP